MATQEAGLASRNVDAIKRMCYTEGPTGNHIVHDGTMVKSEGIGAQPRSVMAATKLG